MCIRDSYNGVAMASLEKPEGVHFGLDDGDPPDYDRLITGVFSGISVLNTYVPQGRERESEHFAYKLKWFNGGRRILQYRIRRLHDGGRRRLQHRIVLCPLCDDRRRKR